MRCLFAAATIAMTGFFASDAQSKVFNNDTFKISQEAANSFGFFANGDRVRTLTGSGDLTTTFTQRELVNLLLPNNGISGTSLSHSSFFEFLARDLRGFIDVKLVGDQVQFIFERSLVTENKTGTVSLKYRRPGGTNRNFVSVTGEALSMAGGGGDDDIPTVIVDAGGTPGSEASGGSNGGNGPFFNDEFTITKNGDAFQLAINGVQLTSIADTGGDLLFSIPENTFKALVLVNNGVTGAFLGDKTEFFDFLAKGNAGLIDVTLGSNISFRIDRHFVLNELSGESSFKYDAGGKQARNFVNFVGKVNAASPSS